MLDQRMTEIWNKLVLTASWSIRLRFTAIKQTTELGWRSKVNLLAASVWVQMIRVKDASAHVTRSLFWRNEARYEGGAMMFRHSNRHETSIVPSLVESCKFEHNVAHDAGSNLRFSDSKSLRLDGNSFGTESCDGDEKQVSGLL